MNNGLLAVSPSPHIHTDLTVPQIMRAVIVAMMPAWVFSVINFGVSAIYVTVLSVVFCMATEYLITRFLLKRMTSLYDGSAVITGMLLAFNVPSSLPWYAILVGSIVSIGLAKMAYGGLGNNPFNPALTGRVFLLLSFPVLMTSWPKTGELLTLDAISSATPLGILKDGLRAGETVPALMSKMPTYTDFFFGFTGGSMGEMSAFALLIGLWYMMHKRIVTWHIPVSMVLTVFIMTGIFWIIDPVHYANPFFHVLTGGVVLGAVFMATDYVTSPFTHRGMLVFGVGIGILTVLIRLFGNYPEGVSFAILIMNAFVPLINQFAKQPRYGSTMKTSSKP